MHVIYALIDPRDNTVHYVGMTSNVYQRFTDHIQCSGTNFAKNAWITELRSLNKMVIMETLEEVETREQAQERESYWIRHFEMLKDPIRNISKTSSVKKAKRATWRISIPSQQTDAQDEITRDVPCLILPEKGPRATSIDIVDAIEAWNKGHNSEDKLMRTFNLTKYQAGLLRKRILKHAVRLSL